jgi:hypothetical protein
MTTDQTPLPAPSRTFRIRSEADVLALVPFTFGFHPEDSLVMITLDTTGRPFQARVDLPEDPADLEVVVEQLVLPAVRNRAHRAVLVGYTDDHALAELATGLLAATLEAAGVEVLLSLRADGDRWFRLDGDGADPDGVPYDVRSHELSSRAVLEGRVTYRNREELADSLAVHDPEEVEEVLERHRSLRPLPTRDVGPGFPSGPAAEVAWLVGRLRTACAEDTPPSTELVARLLRGVARLDVRDALWCEITRDSAAAHVRVWRDVVRRSPEELVAPAAGLLAFAAWLSGDGALAWCAVERSLCADPDHSLARLVAQALERAVPPSAWTPPAAGPA